MQNDEAVVHSIMAVLENWIDPFQSHEQLCHLASGIVATDEVKTYLLNAQAKGLEALGSCANERLGEDGKKDCYAVLPQLQLKTFSPIRWGRQNVDLKPHKRQYLFDRLLVIGQTHKLSMEKSLSYSLGTFSLSIAVPVESPIKKVKSALLKVFHLAQPG